MDLHEQNNGASWRDCNAAGMKHRWFARHSTGYHVYWGCQRCPVDTMTVTGAKAPSGWLRG